MLLLLSLHVSDDGTFINDGVPGETVTINNFYVTHFCVDRVIIVVKLPL